MKKLIKLILTIILLNTFSYAHGLIFCTYPHKNKKELYEEYKPLLQHLEKELKQKVHFTISQDYNNLIELLVNNRVQIAVIGPYNYTKAMKEDKNIQYVVTQQYMNKDKMESSYYSVIVSLKKAGISDLKALKGKRFGFTDFNSTSGYLFPNLVLKQNNIAKSDFSELFMLKQHPHVMEALVRNSIDAGATHYANYVDYTKKYGDKFKILYKSEAIPYDAIVVSSFVNKTLKNKIEKAFLSYKENINGEEVSSYAKKDKSIYDVIKIKAGKL